MRTYLLSNCILKICHENSLSIFQFLALELQEYSDKN